MRNETGATMIADYRQRYGDGPIVLRMAAAPARGVIVHPSTRHDGWQATFFDADGFSSDMSGRDIADLVGEVMGMGFRELASPESFDEQVNSARFTAGEERARQIRAEWEQRWQSALSA